MAHRLELTPGLRRGREVTVVLDGRERVAYEGESVAALIMAEDGPMTRRTVRGDPRGVFCGMGVCFDCLVVVDGVASTRSCMTWVHDGMVVERQQGHGAASAEAGPPVTG